MTATPAVLADPDADLSIDTDARWADALTAAALLAVDPVGLGGAMLRARAGPQRALWLAALRHSLPADVPLRRVPLGIADDRLLGGLDLAATLQAGRPVAQRGVLAEADGGLLVLAMAERLAAGTVARIAATLDTGQVLMERDGLTLRQPARLGVVALDEGVDADETASPVLADRLAFHLVLDGLPGHGPGERRAAAAEFDAASLDALLAIGAADVAAARAHLPQVASGDGTAAALCRAAVALGVDSLRAPWLALRAARAAAALQGHDTVEPDDAALAARLVLGPRATRFPAPPEAQPPEDQAPPDVPPDPPAEPPPADDPPPETPPPEPDPAAQPPPDPPQDDAPPPDLHQPLDEVVLEAALAAMPAGLLAQLKAGAAQRSPAQAAGRVGALQAGGPRGRPLGARRGELRAGSRLDLIATLRAAAPWQLLRQREAALAAASLAVPAPVRRVLVRPEDFHISRRAQRRETTTLFVVDASGSAALHRLAEAKGAVELLLADCYVRRDRVALLAFRGSSAELVLPPTRSLVRAKRALAGLPGGGGTPLALALDAAADLAATLLRRGGTPVLVLLTDARANIARSGAPGRDLATADALASARQLRALGLGMLVVDTAPGASRPSAGAGPTVARQLSDALNARYLPLPQMDAALLSRAARALGAPDSGRRPA